MSSAGLAALGIDLRGKIGGQGKFLCPECSHTRKKKNDPCLSVDLDAGVYHCHNCGWSGIAKGDRNGYGTPPKKEYKRPAFVPDKAPADRAVAYLTSRGIPLEVTKLAGISFRPDVYFPQTGKAQAAICFPYLRGGEVVNVKYRGEGKIFRMEAGAELCLYGLDGFGSGAVGVEAQAPLVWVEGEIDALSLVTAGYPHVVSVPNGAPSPTSKNYARHFDYLASAWPALRQHRCHVLATDADEPGRLLAAELTRRLGPEVCSVASWPEGCKDANDTLRRDGPEGIRAAIEAARPAPVAGIYEVDDVWEGVYGMYQNGLQGGVHPGSAKLAGFYTIKEGQWTLVTGIPGHGKALTLCQPIPTPTGWTTMGQVAVGEWVLDERGCPTRVIAKSPVYTDRRTYRLAFDDGQTVVCAADHEWFTRDDKARRSAMQAVKKRGGRKTLAPRGKDQRHLRSHPSVKTTAEIAATLYVEYGKRANHAIPVAAPLQLSERDLPLDPYVLGVWLGDGTANAATYHKPDYWIAEEIRRRGYDVSDHADGATHSLLGLMPTLRSMGLLGNKHVPPIYLRASERQRRDLLAGLMDTDGSVTPYGRCEFSNTNRGLADAVFELAASLGWKPALITGRAMLNGRDMGDAYRVTWTPETSPFLLPRKANRCKAITRDTNRWRYIVACEEIDPVPMQCVQVDSPSHLYLCGRAMIPTHNSAILDWMLVNIARNHGWRFAVCSPENQPLARHASQLIQIYSGRSFRQLRHSQRMSLTELQEGHAWLRDHFTFILPEPDDLSLDRVLALAAVAVQRHGIKGLVIDPWNELDHSRQGGEREDEHISRALSVLRRFARDHAIHVWLVAHPTKLQRGKGTDGKEGEYPVPTPYDVSGGAHFRNKADMAITVWRKPQEALDGLASETEVHVQKVRFAECGRVGSTTLWYDRATGRYHDTRDQAEGKEAF